MYSICNLHHHRLRAPCSATTMTCFLWPSDAACGSLDGQDLPRSRLVRHLRKTLPLGRHHERCSPVRAAEHTSEAAAVKVDRLQHVTAFADAHAALVGNVTVPHGIARVDADAVRNAAAEVGPHPPVRQIPVRGD